MFVTLRNVLGYIVSAVIIFLVLLTTDSDASDVDGGSPHRMKWKEHITDERAGFGTAEILLLARGIELPHELKGGEYRECDKHTFDSMHVKNHRADPNAVSIDDVFPENDRPRGDADVSSVRHFMTTTSEVEPIMVLEFRVRQPDAEMFVIDDVRQPDAEMFVIDDVRQPDAEMFVIDGVHRLVAAYLTNSPIRYRLYTIEV